LHILEFETITKELGTLELKGNIDFTGDTKLDLDLSFDRKQKLALIKKLIIKGTLNNPKYEIVLLDILKNFSASLLIKTPTSLTKTVAVDAPELVTKSIVNAPKLFKNLGKKDKDKSESK